MCVSIISSSIRGRGYSIRDILCLNKSIRFSSIRRSSSIGSNASEDEAHPVMFSVFASLKTRDTKIFHYTQRHRRREEKLD